MDQTQELQRARRGMRGVLMCILLTWLLFLPAACWLALELWRYCHE